MSILDYGLFMVHSGPRLINLAGLLVQTDADETVLIDTGMPLKYHEDPQTAGAEDGLASFGEMIGFGPQHYVTGQLAACGVDRVDLLILTHGHIDHVGGTTALPDVPVLLGAPERAMERPSYHGDVQPMEWPDTTYHTIAADTQIGPGFEVFFVPGHSPGQLACQITLPESGKILWLSDAISRATEAAEGFPEAWDAEQAAHHAARLEALDYRFMIYGHDPDQRLRVMWAPYAYK